MKAFARHRLWTAPLMLAGLLWVMTASADAQEAHSGNGGAPKGDAPTAAASDLSAVAHDILMRMARHLGDAQAFSVNIDAGYDVVQQSGQKIEFGEKRKVVISRPARGLRMEAMRSDGSTVNLIFTGREIVLLDPIDKVYASQAQAGELDDSIGHVVADLDVRVPLAAMLLTRLPAEFTSRVKSIAYVEKTNLFGTPAHHLAARGTTTDFEIWVSDGDRPVPLRVIITYRTAKGEPQYRAQFSDWNFTPALDQTTFTAQVPDGFKKIPFATELPLDAVHGRKRAAAGGAQ